MLNRIRASVAGETPDSPRHTSSSAAAAHHSSSSSPSPSTPQRGGGLFGFLKQPSVGSNNEIPPPPHGSGSSSSNYEKGITPMGPSTGGFFGGLIGGGGGSAASPVPPSPNMEPDSPRTIRASAAALLKFSTTPPLFANESSSGRSNMNNNGSSRSHESDALFEDQINKRDQHIMKLEHDLQRLQQQHSQLTKDTATIRRQQLESTHRHAVAIRLWRRTNDGLATRVDCFEKETTPAAAKEIAALIRDAAPPNKDSAYLMMLQDQLAKATVKLEHLASQTDIVLQKGEEVVESLREEMNEVIRERCRMEIELMDQENMLEEDMKRLVLRTERRLKRVMGEIDFLEKNAVEALKNQEEEDEEDGCSVDNSDDDEEEEEEEEEDEKNSPKKEEGGEGDDDTKKTTNEEENSEEADAKTESTTQPADTEHDTNTSNNTEHESKKKEDQTPEVLRKELRRIAMDRDQCLSVLQKKLRDKNEEFNALMKLKESRARAIQKIETERRDREEWERGRQEIIA